MRLTNADGRPAYSVGQFHGNRVLNGLPKVLEVLSDVDDELTIASWMTVPKPGLGGRTPLASLHDGDVDQVIEAADDYAARST